MALLNFYIDIMIPIMPSFPPRGNSVNAQNHHDKNVGIKEHFLAFSRPSMEAKDVADILGVDKGSIYKLARSGIIPCFRIGTLVRFDPKKLAEWYDKQCIGDSVVKKKPC
jgi:excisionase family DNA binding protein